MRILTLLAVAAVAGGIYHYRQQRGLAARTGRRADENTLLAQKVRTAVAGATSTRLNVRALNGIVTLRGTVPSRAERDQALAAALTVPGVLQVTNLLETEEPIGEIGTMQSGIASGV